MSGGPNVGDKAPDFALTDANGGTVRLEDFRGKKNVVLFFYPKDDTPGCTIEACTFRDRYDDFAAAGAEVIGISADSAESHQRFAKRHELPMRLLSDESGKVREAFGVTPMLGLLPGRVTFLIDKNGVVRHVTRARFKFKEHVHASLELLRQLEA